MSDIFYGSFGTYEHLKFLVKGNADFNRIKDQMPWNAKDETIITLIKQAKEEIYLEDVIKKTEIGKIIYE